MKVFQNAISFSIDFGLVWPSIAFSISLIVSYLCYPVIIRVSKLKRLMAKPNYRSVHSTKTPNLGGIGIFLAINLIITILGNYFQDEKLLNLLGAMTIMFFIGLIDDLIGVKPKTKLIGQVVAALLVILITNLRITSFHGLLGIYELPYIISVGATVLAFVTLINAYNLIDGVDGLAGSFAITATVFFGCFYYFNANFSMYFLSISMVGALISFLIFNFSKTDKIFMGDTGSMVIGFLLAYQGINFMTVDFNENFMLTSDKSPIYFLALFSFPLIDTIRVFFIRIKSGKSPFTADKNHIHHTFLDYGLKHWKISLLASIFTIFMVFGIFLFNELEINKQILALVAMWIFSAAIVRNMNLSVLLSKLKSRRKTLNAGSFDSVQEKKKTKTISLKDLA